MKHSFMITAFLVALFVVSQLVGLGLVYKDQDVVIDDQGNQRVEFNPTVIGEPPETEGWQSTLFVVIGVTVGTLLLLAMIKFRLFHLWKIWFLLAVWLALAVAFGVLVSDIVAFVLALGLALWKIFRPNVVVHNLTEVFMYAGIAVLIARMFDLLWIVVLLVLISIYDMFAVWKSKHMVKMAEAQTKMNLFAGLYLPKGKKAAKASIPPPEKPGGSVAILGGGDIAFPLLFSSVALVWLIERNVPPATAFLQTLIVTLTATIALSLLFAYSKKGRFYPAMPVLTAGCLAGLGIVALL